MSVPVWAAIVMTLGGAAVGQVAAPLVRVVFPDADERRALDLQFLQVSLGVLSNEAHEGNAAIRGGAVDMVNSVAEVQIEGEAEKSLVLGTTGLVNYWPMASWSTLDQTKLYEFLKGQALQPGQPPAAPPTQPPPPAESYALDDVRRRTDDKGGPSLQQLPPRLSSI